MVKNHHFFLGILTKIPYVMDLGVTAVLLNPIYKSPQKDHGYDITDHHAIDPIFGSLEDFDELATALHREGKFHSNFRHIHPAPYKTLRAEKEK